MITAVCLNPSIDRTLEVSGLLVGGMNRAGNAIIHAGGKAANVALALAELGLRSRVIGFFGEHDRDLFAHRFNGAGVEFGGVWLKTHTRVNIKLADRLGGSFTEINEPGARVTRDDMARMTELIVAAARDSRFLVLSGSLPPGCPTDYYSSIIALSTAPCVLDTHGQALSLALGAGPFLVKPNVSELCELTGARPERLSETGQVADEAEKLAKNARYAVISLGARGAVMANGCDICYAESPEAEAVSTVGAGDCMVAGLLYGLTNHPDDMEAILGCGVAAGAAGVMTGGTGLLTKTDFGRLLSEAKVRRL